MSADLFAAFMADEAKPERPAKVASRASAFSSGNLVDIQPATPVKGTSQPARKGPEPSPLWKTGNDGHEVLFDADENADEDEFGDFETVEPKDTTRGEVEAANHAFPREDGFKAPIPPSSILRPAQDRISADDELLYPAVDEHASLGQQPGLPRGGNGFISGGENLVNDDEDWGDFEQTQPQEPSNLNKLSITPNSTFAQQAENRSHNISDEEWEPFDEEPEVVRARTTTRPIASSKPLRPLASTTSQSTVPANTQRPTNVPPPASLIRLLSKVFDFVHRSNSELSVPPQDLGPKILIIFRTSMRIVAGRTFRWKRDTILAQSVRIGQAGKSGGMKLAAVNKGETTQEQRETEDMIQDWSTYVHEFNSIVARARLPPQRMKLSATTSLKLSNQKSTSDTSKQCALCGLRRNERLTDVDVDVDDLFGEFWVEHWGHKDCCDFWYLYNGMLDQR
jgi:hypothetical protein